MENEEMQSTVSEKTVCINNDSLTETPQVSDALNTADFQNKREAEGNRIRKYANLERILNYGINSENT